MSAQDSVLDVAKLQSRIAELENEVLSLKSQLKTQTSKPTPQNRAQSSHQFGSFTLRRGEVRLELTNAVKRQMTKWLNKVMQPEPPLEPDTLVDSLRTGVFLCELALCISDDAAQAITKIHRNAQPGSLFAIENIQSFLHAAVALGVNARELFDPTCLISNVSEHRRDARELIYALLSFSLAAHVRYGFPAPDLTGTDPMADSTLASCLRTAMVASGAVTPDHARSSRVALSASSTTSAASTSTASHTKAGIIDIVQAVGLDTTLDSQQKLALGLDPDVTSEAVLAEASPQGGPRVRGVPGGRQSSPSASEGSAVGSEGRDSERLSSTSITSAISAPPNLSSPPHVVATRIAVVEAVAEADAASGENAKHLVDPEGKSSTLKSLDTETAGEGEGALGEDGTNAVRPLSKQRFSLLELSAEQEFFFLTALAVKMTHNWQEDVCLISTGEIWEKAVEQKIPFYRFHSFIEHELAKSLLVSETKKRLERAAKLHAQDESPTAAQTSPTQASPDNSSGTIVGASVLRDHRAQLLNKIRMRKERSQASQNE